MTWVKTIYRGLRVSIKMHLKHCEARDFRYSIKEIIGWEKGANFSYQTTR